MDAVIQSGNNMAAYNVQIHADPSQELGIFIYLFLHTTGWTQNVQLYTSVPIKVVSEYVVSLFVNVNKNKSV